MRFFTILSIATFVALTAAVDAPGNQPAAGGHNPQLPVIAVNDLAAGEVIMIHPSLDVGKPTSLQ